MSEPDAGVQWVVTAEEEVVVVTEKPPPAEGDPAAGRPPGTVTGSGVWDSWQDALTEGPSTNYLPESSTKILKYE